jgi:hypothetical protein
LRNLDPSSSSLCRPIAAAADVDDLSVLDLGDRRPYLRVIDAAAVIGRLRVSDLKTRARGRLPAFSNRPKIR